MLLAGILQLFFPLPEHFPPDIPLAHLLTFFRLLLKYHLISDFPLTFLLKISTPIPSTLSSFPFLHNTYQHLTYHIFYLFKCHLCIHNTWNTTYNMESVWSCVK